MQEQEKPLSVLFHDHGQGHTAYGCFPVFVGTGNGGYFLRRGISQEHLSLHFARGLEDGLPAYGIPDGKSNRPDFKDACVGDAYVREYLPAEYAVAEHGFPVNVQGNDLRPDRDRDDVNDVVYRPDIVIVIVKVIDIVQLAVVPGKGFAGEQVVQDQRVCRIYIQRIILCRVAAQIGPVFRKGLGGNQHQYGKAEQDSFQHGYHPFFMSGDISYTIKCNLMYFILNTYIKYNAYIKYSMNIPDLQAFFFIKNSKFV